MLTLFALEREVNIGCANIEIRQIFFKKLFETAYTFFSLSYDWSWYSKYISNFESWNFKREKKFPTFCLLYQLI